MKSYTIILLHFIISIALLYSCKSEKEKKETQTKISYSIEDKIKDAKNDIERIKILEKTIDNKNLRDSIKIKYIYQLKKLIEKNFKEQLKEKDFIYLNRIYAWVLNEIGTSYFIKDEYDSALVYYEESKKILEKLQKHNVNVYNSENKIKYQELTNSIGQTHLFNGNYDQSLDIFNRVIKICEQINDTIFLSRALSYIGLLYFYTSDYDKALQYFEKSYLLEEQMNNKENMSYCAGNIANIYLIQGKYQVALQYYFNNLKLLEEINDLSAVSATLNNIGSIYKNLGNYDLSLQYYQKSLNIKKMNNDKKGIATTLSNIANILVIQGKYKEAMEYYTNSLKYQEQLNDDKGKALTLNNIGLIYENQKDFDHALEYYFKSLKIREQIEDKKGIAESLNNIGYIYFRKGNFTEALNYFDKSLKIRTEIGDKKGIARTLSNIGNIYFVRNDFIKAKEYFNKSIEISEEIADKYTRSKVFSLLSKIYFKENNILKSKEYGEKAYYFGEETGNIENKRDAAEILDSIFWKLGNYKLSRIYHGEYIILRDSIQNEENRKMVLQQYYQLQYEKKKTADSIAYAKTIEIKNLEIEKQQNEARQNKIIAIITFAGVIVVFILLIFVYNSLRTTKKQKAIIENQKDLISKQKEEIEEIHNELKSSIKYAKKIQEAVLPSDKITTLANKEHFILFMPKDVVSGDFYWFTIINNVEIYAVADCTGHGVPGGFMSMLGLTLLNEIVRRKDINRANQVLNEMRKEIINSLKQHGQKDEQKDGMDISLFVIDHNTQTCQWAGANNPLYIISKLDTINIIKYSNNKKEEIQIQRTNSLEGYHLFEIKPDKMPVAIHPIMNDFSNHEFSLPEGSIVYLFSDGYADQFGGEKCKKYTYKRFTNTLLNICSLPLDEQKQHLENEITKWMGSNVQTDDITVMGVKI